MSLRNLLAVLILLSVTALVAALVLNRPGNDVEELLKVLPKQVDLTLEKIHYTQTEGGQRRWTLDAESASYQRKAGLINLQNIEMVFFDVGRFTEVKMTAMEGLFDQLEERVEVWGNAEILTDRGDHFYAERLLYDRSEGRVTSDGPVRMVSPRLDLSGVGFWLDLKAARMSILQNVTARLITERDERSDN